MGIRREARIAAAQVLYQLDTLGDFDAVALALERHFTHMAPEVAPEAQSFAAELCRGTVARRGEIDRQIERASPNWRLSRMTRVDRNILRVAVYELLATPDVPVTVVINEAIDLAKLLGSSESQAFINGVLDRVAHELPASSARARP